MKRVWAGEVCDDECREQPGPGDRLEITFPIDLSFVDELGLGKLNRTVSVTGTRIGCGHVLTPCPAELDGSGAVDIGDLLIVLAACGPCQP